MPTLDDVRGKYAGRSALIMGAGPSLRHVHDRPLILRKYRGRVFKLPDVPRPSPLHRHVVIAVNDAVLKMPDADFYFTSDPGMIQYCHWDLVAGSDITLVLNAPGFGREPLKVQYGIDPERIILYEKRRASAGVVLRQSDHRIIYGPSSAHCAANFAVMLGCRRIYFLGMDCRCENGLKYFWQFGNQPGPGGTKSGHPNHHLSALAAKGKKVVKGVYDDFNAHTGRPSKPTLNGWTRVARENPGLMLLDASGGALTGIIQTVTLEQMLAGKI